MILSIIIPVYNAEKFIERCINSILIQSINKPSIEIIVINDGSTDKSYDILEKIAKKNSTIKLFTQENKGEGHTRNLGLQKANGEFIWFIDADDYISDNILNDILESLNSQGIEIICFGHKRVNLIGEKLSETKYFKAITCAEELIEMNIYHNNVCFKVIKNQLIKNNRLIFNPNVKTATDFDFSFRIMFQSEKILLLDNTGYNYVVNPDSISNIRSNRHLERLANDSIIVGLGLKMFLNNSEKIEKIKIFQQWLNNYWYGLFFSLFRFNYSIHFIKEKIEQLRVKNIYPVENQNYNLKKGLFMFFANRSRLFTLLCSVRQKIKP